MFVHPVHGVNELETTEAYKRQIRQENYLAKMTFSSLEWYFDDLMNVQGIKHIVKTIKRRKFTFAEENNLTKCLSYKYIHFAEFNVSVQHFNKCITIVGLSKISHLQHPYIVLTVDSFLGVDYSSNSYRDNYD